MSHASPGTNWSILGLTTTHTIESGTNNKLSLYALAATAAAVGAAIGDVLMLLVVHSGDWPARSPNSARSVLWFGGLLGLILIPLYFRGYLAAIHVLEPHSKSARTGLIWAAAGTACIGAIAHALNAAVIDDALTSGRPLPLPTEVILPEWSVFFIAGSLATTCALIASTMLCWIAWRRGGQLSYFAFLNPITCTLFLLLIALGSQDYFDYIAFAAPNLGHAIFFMACRRALRKKPDEEIVST